MTLLMALTIVAAMAGFLVVFLTWRHQRTPPELRGNWWPQFEREFRAYARTASRAAGGRRRGARDRRPPQR